MKFFRASILLAGVAAVCASGQTPAFNTGQAARLVIGQKNFTFSDFGATNQLIGAPSGIAYANGTLWVTDSNRLGSTPNNNRVLRFSDVGTFPKPLERPDVLGSTCGACRGTASLVLGQPDFVSTAQNLNSNGLRRPSGIATDGNVLAIADTDNNRVLVWLTIPKSNNQPADVVIGQPDFTHGGTSVPPTQTSLRGPSGVWIAGGKLYIADAQDNRILIFNKIPTSNNAPADVVVGQASFTAFVQPDLTSVQPTTAANNMQTPVSVSTDGTRMFVSDLGQNRVLIFNTIPTSNGAAADVAIGQPDLTSSIENNSFKATDNTPVLCATNGTNTTTNVPTFPQRCGKTLSFPRFALSDGKRLFVADGGNDRILLFNSIPTTSGAAPDVILGQPDEFSDNTGDNPDGTNAFQTPTSLALDGTSLYVSDTYNRRVVIYSPGVQNIPLDGIRNAASEEIAALGSVTLAGTITEKDTVTVTIAGTPYVYTVLKTDTLDTVVLGLIALINKGPDPNVVATANISAEQIQLTAKKPGADGGNIAYSVATSLNATIVASAGGAALNIFLENPSKIAPGTIIEVNGKNLCDTSAAGDLTQAYLPFSLKGCTLYIDGVAAPLLYVSPTQINAQMPNEATDRTSVSIYTRVEHADGSVTVSTPVASTIVPQNPGIFAQPGTDPRKGILFHGTSKAFDLVALGGSFQVGDIGTITIAGNNYTYTVQASDTQNSVRDGLIAAINNAPDPLVHASAANEFSRIILTAIKPGSDGEGTSVAVAVSTDTVKNPGGPLLLLTAYSSSLCCTNTEGALVTDANPAVPGELVYTFATGLGVTEPQDQDTGKIFRDTSSNPPAVPVDSILTGASSANIVSASLVPGTVGVYKVQFLLSSGLIPNAATPLTIAQQAFVSNVVTFPVQVPGLATHFSIVPDATTVKAGDAHNYTITALDFQGGVVINYPGTIAITSSDPAATLPANATLTLGTGTVSVTLNTLGVQTVTATDIGAASLTGTSANVNVTATGASAVRGRGTMLNRKVRR